MSIKIYSLEQIIDIARTNSPYYADLYKDIPKDAPLSAYPLVDSADFWAHCDKDGGSVATRKQTDGQIFKSGGTTGEPKYSLYSYEEWQTMCECSAALMTRGGLVNGNKVANLFYAGGLYASFLYTYYIFTNAAAKVMVYNLSGNISIEEMVDTILTHRIDCVAGLPSIFTKMIAYINEKKLTGFNVKTIYFAGETLHEDQRKKICETFGREIDFRSVFYASNDGGSIGYFTKDCGFNEHRVMSDLCIMELIDPDTGEVIEEKGRPGVIYVTSLFKTLIPLIRYPAGDMGMYTEDAGTPDRKFKLLGRSDSCARAGYVSLYPTDVENVLRQCGIEYYSFQIVITHDEKDKFTFKIAANENAQPDTEKFLSALYLERSLIKDAIDADTLYVPEVVWCKPEDLEYNPRTGKLKTILDKRFK